jgi:hypothetical protein
LEIALVRGGAATTTLGCCLSLSVFVLEWGYGGYEGKRFARGHVIALILLIYLYETAR